MLGWASKGAAFLSTWRGSEAIESHDGDADAWAYVVHPTFKQAYKYMIETVMQVGEQPTAVLVEYDNGHHVLYWTDNEEQPYDLHAWRMVPLNFDEISAINDKGVMVTRSIMRRGQTQGSYAYTGR